MRGQKQAEQSQTRVQNQQRGRSNNTGKSMDEEKVKRKGKSKSESKSMGKHEGKSNGRVETARDQLGVTENWSSPSRLTMNHIQQRAVWAELKEEQQWNRAGK